MFRHFLTALLLFLSLLCIRQSETFAQQEGRGVPDFFKEIIREKLRIDPNELERLLSGGESAVPWESKDILSKKSLNEVIVSEEPNPESEIHAVINPKDPSNIVVSFIRDNPDNPKEALLVPVYYTKDFGHTWRKSGFANFPREENVIILGGGDPVLVFDADGKLYFTWIYLYLQDYERLYWALYWAYSLDGGKSWIRTNEDIVGKAGTSIFASLTEAYDKQWLAVDRTNSPFRNTLYMAFLYINWDEYRIELRKKTPDKEAFTKTSVRVSSPGYKFVQFSSIDVDPKGGVHVTFFGSKDSLHYALWHALSTDGGDTFQTETKVSDVIFPRFSIEDRDGEILGFNQERQYPCPQIVAEHSSTNRNGNLYMVWTANGVHEKREDGTDIYFSGSTDNGTTWSEPVIVNDDPRGLARDQFHPSIAVNENGIIAVTWYDRRDDENNLLARHYLAYSFDGGRSFTKNIPVSSAPMDIGRGGVLNRGFSIGEYAQVVMTQDYAIPFWADGRRNSGNLDVYSAFIPIKKGTLVERVSPVTEGFHLYENYPNPFNPTTTISYSIESRMRIILSVTNALGVTLATIVDETQDPGFYRYSFDASELPSGLYYYTLITDEGSVTKSMTLLK